MNSNPKIPQEEIDLGTLFGQLHKMFSGMFRAIGNFFNNLFNLLIRFIIFIRKNALILGVATLLGGLIGFFVEKDKPKVFESEMYLDLGYGSGTLLYKEVENLNTAIAKGKRKQLEKFFQLPSAELSTLVNFSIDPIDKEKYFHRYFDKFKLVKEDTVYTNTIEFKDYLQRIDEKDLRHYKIIAKAYADTIFPKLDSGFVRLIENDYYKGLQHKKMEELLFNKNTLLKDIAHIDSLHKRYKEIAYLQAEQVKNEKNGGVSFKTINQSAYKGNRDIDLFHERDSLRLELKEINNQIVENESIVKIESGFSIGNPQKGILKHKWARFAVLGFLLVFAVLVLLQFNKYLNRFETK